MAEKAARTCCSRRAGAHMAAYRQAIALLSHANELLPQAPEGPDRRRLELDCSWRLGLDAAGTCDGPATQAVGSVSGAGQGAGDRAGGFRRLFRVLCAQIMPIARSGELRQARQLADSRPPSRGAGRERRADHGGCSLVANAAMCMNDLEVACAYLERARALYDPAHVREHRRPLRIRSWTFNAHLWPDLITYTCHGLFRPGAGAGTVRARGPPHGAPNSGPMRPGSACAEAPHPATSRHAAPVARSATRAGAGRGGCGARRPTIWIEAQHLQDHGWRLAHWASWEPGLAEVRQARLKCCDPAGMPWHLQWLTCMSPTSACSQAGATRVCRLPQDALMWTSLPGNGLKPTACAASCCFCRRPTTAAPEEASATRWPWRGARRARWFELRAATRLRACWAAKPRHRRPYACCRGLRLVHEGFDTPDLGRRQGAARRG